MLIAVLTHNKDACLACSLLESGEYATIPQDKAQTPEQAKDHAHLNAEESLTQWENELKQPGRPKMEKAPGNREREAIFRAIVALEKRLDELPTSHGQVAGWLQALGYEGGVRGDDNALAEYLQSYVDRDLLWNATLGKDAPKVNVLVEANGTIIESPRYQVCLDPEKWQEMFMIRLRQGDFPELLAQ